MDHSGPFLALSDPGRSRNLAYLLGFWILSSRFLAEFGRGGPIQARDGAVSASRIRAAIRPAVTLRSCRRIMRAFIRTITLPLYRGQVGRRRGNPVWFILTDSSDVQAALSLGLNFSQKLQFAGAGARTATLADTNGQLIFDRGKVDFSPERQVEPGPTEQPLGSSDDEAHSDAAPAGGPRTLPPSSRSKRPRWCVASDWSGARGPLKPSTSWVPPT